MHIYFIFYFLNVVSCTQPTTREGYVDPVKIFPKIFNDIDYLYLNMLKKEKSEINLAYVNKNDMTKKYFNNILINRIKKEGWKEVNPEFQDQNLFCFGSKNMMSVVYPNKEVYTNSKGDSLSIKSENLDKWVISFIYNYHGFRGVRSDLKSVVLEASEGR